MTESSSSAFVVPEQFSQQWSDITLQKRHTHTLIYTAIRYGRRFVLKTLPPQDAQLTEYKLHQEKEFLLGIQLVHPSIAATYSLEVVPDVGRCIVQEYIDGKTLGEWVLTKPSSAARKRVMGQLLDVLEYIHSLQLVHHDLKADNILITRNGANVKLIDFGLSETDDSQSSFPNDVHTDIQAFGKLISTLLPHQYPLVVHRCKKGAYPNITALRQSLRRRQQTIRYIPYLLMALVAVFAAYFTIINKEQNDVNTNEIEQVLTNFYQPFCDSLDAGYWKYQEIARLHFGKCYNPMSEYERMVSRYPTGSAQHATFTNTWTTIYSNKVKDIYRNINSLPSYSAAEQEGTLSPEDTQQWLEEVGRK